MPQSAFSVPRWIFLFCLIPFGTRAETASSGSPPPTVTLSALPTSQRAILYGSPEDELKKKPCEGKWRVTLHCRDKLHYVKSNESRHDVYRPYLRNIGGGYVGVGSDQNFTLIAYARSSFVWLMDYDPVVVWTNMIHRAFILKSPTREDYLRMWHPKERNTSIRYLGTFYKKHPDRHQIVWVYKSWGGVLHYHFLRRHNRREAWKKQNMVYNESWLALDSTYQYIRTLFQTDRIRVLKGDLLLHTTLIGIGKTSHALNLPIRVFYFSNAEQFWPYIAQFRKNILGLKMDEKSVIARTLASPKYKPALDYIWVYIVQPGLHFQAMLRDKKTRSVWVLASQMKKVSKGIYELGDVKRYAR